MPGLFKRRKRASPDAVYPITVNTIESFDGLVAQGRFHLVKEDIGKAGFPDVRRDPYAIEVRMVDLCGAYEIYDVPKALDALADKGFRGLTARELLEFCAQHPEAQYGYSSVAALGAVREIDGVTTVLTVWDREDWRRELDIHLVKGHGLMSWWMRGHIFPAVEIGSEQTL